MSQIAQQCGIRRAGVVIAVLAALGCGPAGAGGGRVSPERRDVLTRDEILSSNAREGDLFQAIRSLRPNFLMLAPSVHSRGSTAASPLAVYIGNVRQAGVQSLRTIPATRVAEVRYLDPTTAQNTLGPMASGGALVITLYDESRPPTR